MLDNDSIERKLDLVSEEIHKHMRSMQKNIKDISDKMDTHIIDFEKHEVEENLKYLEYNKLHKDNALAIENLIAQLKIQSIDTQGLIALWKTTISFIDGVNKLRNLLVWICTTIIAFGGVYTLLHTLGVIK